MHRFHHLLGRGDRRLDAGGQVLRRARLYLRQALLGRRIALLQQLPRHARRGMRYLCRSVHGNAPQIDLADSGYVLLLERRLGQQPVEPHVQVRSYPPRCGRARGEDHLRQLPALALEDRCFLARDGAPYPPRRHQRTAILLPDRESIGVVPRAGRKPSHGRDYPRRAEMAQARQP